MFFRRKKKPEKFNQKDWKKEIDADEYSFVIMNQDKSISVHLSSGPPGTYAYAFRKQPIEIQANSKSARALLEIIGPLKPGEMHSFFLEEMKAEKARYFQKKEKPE